MAAQAKEHFRDYSDFYYEDAIVGESIATPSYTVTKEDILRFGEVTLDKHPLHADEAFCQQHTPYGGIIGHGLYGVALMEGLKHPLKLYYRTSPASLGWDKIRFLKPIFPNDTLRARITFIDKRESRSKPDRGVVRERIELINQDDEIVTEAEHVTMLIKHPRQAGEAAPSA